MQLSAQIRSKKVRSMRKQMTGIRSLPLMVTLSLFLLFSQVLETAHSHKADLLAQFDCETCLKIGSLEDVALSKASSLSLPAEHQIFSILIQSLTSSELVKAAARGPPSYT